MQTPKKVNTKLRKMTPVKVTTEIGAVKIVQDFETDQPVDQEAVKQAIAAALFHLGIRPKR